MEWNDLLHILLIVCPLVFLVWEKSWWFELITQL